MVDRKHLEEFRMLPKGSRVLAAVSGGADSVCLLHMLCCMRPDIELWAAHYEHGIRGEEALEDCRFTEALCRRLQVPCVVEHGDVPGYAREKGLGTEEAARELRYAFLERTADALGCDRIATAHNANDNAETVLFHLTRGAGLAGLGGIPPVRGRVIRPLLWTSRREIEAYLAENKLPHREDSSNNDTGYSRNRIRAEVMPVLEGMNPSFPGLASENAQLLREDEAYLTDLAREFLTGCGGEALETEQLLRLPLPVARRAVRLLCGNIGHAHVARVLVFAAGTEHAVLEVPGCRLVREQGRICRATAKTGEEILPRELPAEGSLCIPEAGLVLRTGKGTAGDGGEKQIHSPFKTCTLKCESISGKVLATGRRAGDKLRPRGRGCTKTLKQLFTEAGYTAEQKKRAVVIRDDAGILAVPGLGTDERCTARPGEAVLYITIENMGD